MGAHDYRCDDDECKFEKVYYTSPSLPKDMKAPADMKCPDCEHGYLEKLFTATKFGIDVPGGYDYTYGKKAKHLKSTAEQADIIAGRQDPY
tara:strand:- start:11619 stop:11891 length:273 start_codon:yes stop_codon:yes gene_type:complete